MYDCEFSRYHEYLYLPGDTVARHVTIVYEV